MLKRPQRTNRAKIELSRKLQLKKLDSPVDGYKNAIDSANQALAYAAYELKQCSVPFDSRLSKLDLQTCVTSLVSNRIHKKFHILNGRDQRLRDVAITGFTEYEKDLKGRLEWFSLSDNPLLWSVRRNVFKILRNYHVDYSREDIDVGPGETFNPSSGLTQLIAKLDDISHWTTYESCLEETCWLIYQHRTLKRAARRHIGTVPRSVSMYLHKKYKDHPCPGYAIFSELLKCFVLTVVQGSRLSSVSKNVDTDRVINIEALFPMILQRYEAHALLKCLKQNGHPMGESVSWVTKSGEKFPDPKYDKRLMDAVGSYLKEFFSDRQAIHKAMIRKSHYATVDFSNASDSVACRVVETLFPKRVVNALMKLRAPVVHVSKEKGFVPVFKLSSMGCGFTFEVMTVLLLATARAFSDDVSVFGDDVIIPNIHAKSFIKLCEVIGFRANNKKTFINSPFRESCGGFYHDDYGDILSFDFTQCESYTDVIISHNKLLLVLDKNREMLSSDVFNILEDTLRLLSELACASRTGPYPDRIDQCKSSMGLYFFDNRYRKKHLKSTLLKDRYKRCVERCKDLFTAYQLPLHSVVVVSVTKYVPKRVPLKKDKERNKHLKDLVRLKNLRPTVETVRGKGHFVEVPAFVCVHTGRVTLVSSAVHLQREMKRQLPKD